jgi:hypothetical protein
MEHTETVCYKSGLPACAASFHPASEQQARFPDPERQGPGSTPLRGRPGSTPLRGRRWRYGNIASVEPA